MAPRFKSTERYVPKWKGNDQRPAQDQFHVEMVRLSHEQYTKWVEDLKASDHSTITVAQLYSRVMRGPFTADPKISFIEIEDADGVIRKLDSAEKLCTYAFLELNGDLRQELVEAFRVANSFEGAREKNSAPQPGGRTTPSDPGSTESIH